MEDVWFVAHLDTHWNHPINVGWMNYFQRWACAPLFRLWWPLLSPQFNLRFRRFMEGQCDLPRSFGFITDNNLRRRSQGGDFDKGLAWQVAQRTCSVDSKATEIYGLEVSLKDDTPGQPTRHSLQLAVLGVQIKDREAHWHGDDVFILPGLWNSGFGTPFIRLILDDLGTRGLTECCVMLSPREKDEPKLRTDTGSRHELADHIEFYRNLGFSQREGRLVQKLPVSA
jgi:hypothetical protein